MNQQDNQSIISNGVSESVSEVALAGTLEDLNVQNADAIKGGPLNVRNSGGGYDIIVFDIIDSHH